MISIKKVLKALATRSDKPLWSGSWNSGTITVPDTDKYKMFTITMSGQGTSIILIKKGNSIRGMGGYCDSTAAYSYQFNASYSGNVWTFLNSHYIRHTAGTTHSATVATTITSIRGLW